MVDLFWLRSFIAPLNRLEIGYMVTGSVAAMIAGEPRMTLDVDLVIRLRPEHLERFVEAFPSPEFYLPPKEILIGEIHRENRGHFNVIDSHSMIKADFYTDGKDPLHAWALDRTQAVDVGDLTVHVAPLEYVILRKLEFYREGGSSKHLRDIASMLSLSGDRMDHSWLEAAIAERGLADAWNSARQD